MWHANETVVLKASTQWKKRSGTLFLTNERLVWTVHEAAEADVSLPFRLIKAQFVNQASQAGRIMLKITGHASDSEFLFLFTATPELALKERDAFKDALAQILGRLKTQPQSSSTTVETAPVPAAASTSVMASSATPAEKQPAPITRPVITKEDLKLRATLLGKNKDLQRLHKELVLTGLLTEEEFWESRRALLVGHHLQNKQKKGLPSSLLADIRPTTDTSSSDIKYTLTPAIIHSIFLQYPQVHRIYQQNVPDKLSEKEFWTKYFQSKFFHRDRLQPKDLKQAAQETDLFASCLAEVQVGNQQRRSLHVSPLIDLSTSVEEEENHGQIVEKRAISTTGIQSLVEKLNRHGDLILKSSTGHKETGVMPPGRVSDDTSRSTAAQDSLAYEDLEKHVSDEPAILDIRDTKTYFESLSNTMSSSPSSGAVVANSDHRNSTLEKHMVTDSREPYEFRESDLSPPFSSHSPFGVASEWHLKLDKLVPLGEYQRLSDPSFSDPSATSRSQSHEQIFDRSVSASIRQELAGLHANLTEILRHFWATAPSPSAAADQTNKHVRMIQTLRTVRQNLILFQTSCDNEPVEVRHHLQLILRPMFQSIRKALDEH